MSLQPYVSFQFETRCIFCSSPSLIILCMNIFNTLWIFDLNNVTNSWQIRPCLFHLLRIVPDYFRVFMRLSDSRETAATRQTAATHMSLQKLLTLVRAEGHACNLELFRCCVIFHWCPYLIPVQMFYSRMQTAVLSSTNWFVVGPFMNNMTMCRDNTNIRDERDDKTNYGWYCCIPCYFTCTFCHAGLHWDDVTVSCVGHDVVTLFVDMTFHIMCV